MLVKYNRPNIHDAYGVRFIPGVNDVSPDGWALCKKDSEIAKLLEDGVFEEFEESKEASKDLSTFVEKKAIALVKETYDLDLLKAWKETELRAKVFKAIESQILEMTPPPPKEAA